MEPTRSDRRRRTAALVALAVAVVAVPVAFHPAWGSAGGRLLPLAAIPFAGAVAVVLALRTIAGTRGGRSERIPRADVALLVAGGVVLLGAVPALVAAVVLVAGP
jgi:membrane protease YdiL (CAAX protease family)